MLLIRQESDGEAVSPIREEAEEVDEVLSSSSTEDLGAATPLQPIKADKLIVLQLDASKGGHVLRVYICISYSMSGLRV